MQSPFTEDFFKNLIGFSTILIIGVGIIMFAGANTMPQTQSISTTQTAHTVY